MATRLDILNIWLREVDRGRQAQTIITLYNASNSAGKDAIFNAFKADVVALLSARDAVADTRASSTQADLNEANAVT